MSVSLQGAEPASTRAGCIETLETPCLLLDRDRLDANIGRMRNRLAAFEVIFRPHLKTAKSVDVARRVLPGSSGPATVSTLKEAEVFAAAGITDLVYAVGIAPSKLDRIVRLRRAGVEIAVVLDSVEQAHAVCQASRAAGLRIPALIEIDCDGHRSGLLPGDGEKLVAIGTMLNDGAELRGVLTHAGDSYGARHR
jgi:D-serine deaminase-like pyridoxal phosphate-dependent protein